MVFVNVYLRTQCVMMLFLLHTAADCVGDTLNYNESGIFVPFRNLCGRDVTADVDFNSFRVANRKGCLTRCVMAGILCYGFDFLEHVETYNNPPRDKNCWLHGVEYTEQQTEFLGTNDSNAAMLMPEFRREYQKKCGGGGLLSCLQKELVVSSSGSITIASPTLGSGTAPVPSSSMTLGPTSSSSSPSASNDSLSTGAKAGIGVGVGAFALLGIISVVVLLLRRRESRVRTDENLGEPHQSDERAEPVATRYASELKAPNTQELEGQSTQELGPQETYVVNSRNFMSGQRHMAELQ